MNKSDFALSCPVCMRAALRSSVCPTWKILCLNEPSPCLHLFSQGGSNQQAGTDKILSKMTSAATAAGCGTERRGGREREKREREENNWPEATWEREVTWLLSWPRTREGSSRKGWSPQSGLALCSFWWVPLWPSSPPLPPPFSSHPPSRTAACHGSLHRNKMISSHLLMNTGHHCSHARAGPFVLDRDHWYVGGGAAAEGWKSQYCFCSKTTYMWGV